MTGNVLLGLSLVIRGLVFDGLPPERFQNDATVTTAFVSDLSVYCGKLPASYQWGGCYDFKRHLMFAQNPCMVSGDYAFHLCHELGHAEGWSQYHEF